MNHEHGREPDGGNAMKRRARWVFAGFLAIAAYFFITEHRAHLSGWLSTYGVFVLLLACPVLHLFMHGKHGHGSRGKPDPGSREK
jgi:cell division protein FtsW (lipid II flippase)